MSWYVYRRWFEGSPNLVLLTTEKFQSEVAARLWVVKTVTGFDAAEHAGQYSIKEFSDGSAPPRLIEEPEDLKEDNTSIPENNEPTLDEPD